MHMMALVGYEMSSSDDEEPSKSFNTKTDGRNDYAAMTKGATLSHNLELHRLTTSAARGGIKISAPEIPVADSDSDEETSSPAKKFSRKSNSNGPRSGLFARLPDPINARAQKQPNTKFLPYVFSKPKKEDIVTGKVDVIKEGYGKDGAGSSTLPSMTELQKKDSGNVKPKETSRTSSESVTVPSIAEIRKRSAQASAKLLSHKSDTGKEKDEDDSDEDVGFFSYVEKVSPDQIPEPDLIEPKQGTKLPEAAPDVQIQYTSHQNAEYTIPYAIKPARSLPSDPLALKTNSAEMLRLQGKRNRNEQISFIDIHQDDALDGGKEMLLKHISEEKGIDRSQVNVPGGMMKKKHQLPYLIQQAKAREVELKNNWAQNRLSKQQTQSKYGW